MELLKAEIFNELYEHGLRGEVLPAMVESIVESVKAMEWRKERKGQEEFVILLARVRGGASLLEDGKRGESGDELLQDGLGEAEI